MDSVQKCFPCIPKNKFKGLRKEFENPWSKDWHGIGTTKLYSALCIVHCVSDAQNQND